MRGLKKYIQYGLVVTTLLASMNVLAAPTATNLSREEMAVKVVNQLGYKGIAKAYGGTSKFKDVTSNKGEIYLMSELDIMNGVSDTSFNPSGKVGADTEAIINQRVSDKLGKELGWKHGFYALSSSSQMERIKGLDAVSFGWGRLEYNTATKQYTINTTGSNGNDFQVPTGFQIPIDFAKANGVETYFMIYFEDQNGLAKQFLTNPNATKQVINDIVRLCKGISKDGETRGFDGITIDFENFVSKELQSSYNQFLMQLDQELTKINKKLNVAVQPGTYFKGYDYKTIGKVADRVIVMAHDYAPKKLSPMEIEVGRTYTPQTPIDHVYKDLAEITNGKTGIVDKNKVVLQISFGATQWQTKDGKVLNQKPYTPSTDKVEQRLTMQGVQVSYDELAQNPYAMYTQDGISNMIWYENARSVTAKENLAKLMGLGGISYWRLGNIPTDVK